LSRSIVEAIFALELGDDRILEAGCSTDSRIFRKTAINGCNRGIFDVLRGIEIGFAGAQPDNILAFRFQTCGPGSDSQSRGGLDGLNAL
jgi:hypothetical protein